MGFEAFHLLIVVGIVVVPVLVAAALVVGIVLAIRRRPRTAPAKAERLAELDALHAAGSISDSEREQARARIIAE